MRCAGCKMSICGRMSDILGATTAVLIVQIMLLPTLHLKIVHKNPRQEFFVSYKLDSDNIIRLTDTYRTHLTLKCFVPNSHLDKRTGFTAALLCRLLENNKRGALADLPHSGTQYRHISNGWHNYTQTRSSASWGSVSSTQCWKSLQFKGRDVTTRFDKQGCRQGGYQGDCRAFVSSAF